MQNLRYSRQWDEMATDVAYWVHRTYAKGTASVATEDNVNALLALYSAASDADRTAGAAFYSRALSAVNRISALSGREDWRVAAAFSVAMTGADIGASTAMTHTLALAPTARLTALADAGAQWRESRQWPLALAPTERFANQFDLYRALGAVSAALVAPAWSIELVTSIRSGRARGAKILSGLHLITARSGAVRAIDNVEMLDTTIATAVEITARLDARNAATARHLMTALAPVARENGQTTSDAYQSVYAMLTGWHRGF